MAASTEDDAEAATPQTPQAMSRHVSDISEDRNQEDIQNLPEATDAQPTAAAAQAQAQSAAVHNEGQYSSVTGNVSKDEMINISSCEFPQFKQFMSEKYGESVFDQGFAIIRANQDVIFEDNGEQRLTEQLAPLFSDPDLCSGFINYCTTYLIVQNMNVGV